MKTAKRPKLYIDGADDYAILYPNGDMVLWSNNLNDWFTLLGPEFGSLTFYTYVGEL